MMLRRLYALYCRTEQVKRWFSSRFTTLGKLFLLASLMAFFFGLSVQRTMIYHIFTLTMSLLLFSCLMTRKFSSSLRITRNLPAACIAGKELNYTLSLQNKSDIVEKGYYVRESIKEQLPLWPEFNATKEEGEEKRNIFDRKMKYYRWLWLCENGRIAQADDYKLPDIEAKMSIDLKVKIVPLRRGNIHLSGHIVTKLDPFGLCKKEVHTHDADNLLVLPRLYSVSQLLFEGSRKYHRGGIVADQDRGDSNEFVALREYVHGDPVKHIDWKATARTGGTIVRQYCDEYFCRYGLVLDSFTTKSYCTRFEEAVSVAASILLGESNVNAVLDLLFVGKQCVTCTVGRGLSGHQRMLKTLASVETCGDKPFAELAALVRSHSSLLSGVVVILISLDNDRNDLLNYLTAHSLPTKVVLITDNRAMTESQLADIKPNTPIKIIDTAHVAEQVMQL